MIRIEPRTPVPFAFAIAAPVIAAVAALVLAAIMFALTGALAHGDYALMLTGVFGSLSALGATLTRAVPLILTGLAASLAFRLDRGRLQGGRAADADQPQPEPLQGVFPENGARDGIEAEEIAAGGRQQAVTLDPDGDEAAAPHLGPPDFPARCPLERHHVALRPDIDTVPRHLRHRFPPVGSIGPAPHALYLTPTFHRWESP